MCEWSKKQSSEGRQGRRRSSAKRSTRYNNNNYCQASWMIPNELRVPSWEVDFCRYEGMKWNNFLKAKEFAHLFKNILNWNDSEGEKAFHDAKARYWAQINGFESDIPIPDPEIYIDHLNQDEIPDSNMFDDLTDARGEFPCDTENVSFSKAETENVIIWGDFLLNGSNGEEKIELTGWEDANFDHNGNYEDEKILPTGWGDTEAKWTWTVNDGNDDNCVYPWSNENKEYAEVKLTWTTNEGIKDGKFEDRDDNCGFPWGNENKKVGVRKSTWTKNRNGNWNSNNQKIWRKKGDFQ